MCVILKLMYVFIGDGILDAIFNMKKNVVIVYLEFQLSFDMGDNKLDWYIFDVMKHKP